jgi:tRNA(adenine34) deaminase
MKSKSDEALMREALEQAKRAFSRGEVPVGALVVHQGRLIGSAYNRCEAFQDPTAHAEILAIREASRELGSYRLIDTEFYVTVEPCIMCAGALHLARVSRVIYGCCDPKGGGLGSLYRIHEDDRLNHRLKVRGGILEEECRELMQSFFRQLRDPIAGSTLMPPTKIGS